MEAEFGFVDDYRRWRPRLQEAYCETNEPDRAVGQLIWLKGNVASFLLPMLGFLIVTFESAFERYLRWLPGL